MQTQQNFYKHEESIVALISVVRKHGRRGLKKLLERSGKCYADVYAYIKGVRKDRKPRRKK